MNNLFHTLIKNAEVEPFAGWNFSYISDTGRIAYEPLPWNYTSLLFNKIKTSQYMLDMGTGGGEFLEKLQPLPPFTAATEGYAPNVPLAKKRLEPLGVIVQAITNDDDLPFEDEQFDLIINRHEAYSTWEIMRILKPGGVFVTQQVGGLDNIELNNLLGVEKDFIHWNLGYAVDELKREGFSVNIAKEDFPYTRFYDIGAVIYYLKAIPWQIPHFKVEDFIVPLEKIHKEINEQGFIDIRSHRFFIEAEKA